MAAGGSADLSARLQRLPSDGRRIVLVRAALRGFAGIARVGEGPWSFGGAIERPIIVQALRVIFVAWAQSAFDGVRPEALGEATRALQAELAKFDREFASYYRQNIMGSDYACGAWQQNAEAGRRAANLAEWAGRGQLRRWSFDEPHAYRDDFDTLARFGPSGNIELSRWRELQKQAMAADLVALEEHGVAMAELAFAPLWPNAASQALDTVLTNDLWFALARQELLGSALVTWLRERKHGTLAMGLPPEEAAPRLVRAANLPASVWDDQPAAVAAHVLGEAIRRDVPDVDRLVGYSQSMVRFGRGGVPPADAEGMIAITDGAVSARIHPLGAELWSMTDEAGREYMTDADPAFWTGHAPLLFPIVGALNGGRYRHEGREYALPKHGFARTSRFEVVRQTREAVTFRLTDNGETRPVWPFAFELFVAYRLGGRKLATTATVVNCGNSEMPFSFGFHPAFAWPLPGGGAKRDHAIRFVEEEPHPVKRLDPDGLIGRSEPTPVVGRELPLRPELFADDALIWDQLDSRGLSYGGAHGGGLWIHFPDLPMLGVWQKPGANYICIEPWAGIADPAGFEGELRDKPGVMILPPGAERSFRMDVTVPSV